MPATNMYEVQITVTITTGFELSPAAAAAKAINESGIKDESKITSVLAKKVL
jgi:hypothetical protein